MARRYDLEEVIFTVGDMERRIGPDVGRQALIAGDRDGKFNIQEGKGKITGIKAWDRKIGGFVAIPYETFYKSADKESLNLESGKTRNISQMYQDLCMFTGED